MSGLGILAVVLVVAVLVALTGLRPGGSRPASETKLMSVGRVTLVVAVVLIALIAWRLY